MLTLLLFILMIFVFGKLLMFAIKATWSISKVVFTLILLPLFLIGLVFKGLIFIAVPILLIVGAVSLAGLHD